jgi:Na+-transporting NADH:ubiquinone oxidoreductase subunit NqrB
MASRIDKKLHMLDITGAFICGVMWMATGMISAYRGEWLFSIFSGFMTGLCIYWLYKAKTDKERNVY